MTTAAYNKSIVIRFNKEFIEAGDMQAFHDIVDPTFINHTAPAGIDNGPDGVAQMILEVMRKALTDLRVNIIQQVAEDDLVTTRKTITGTHTAAFMGIPPSGKAVTLHIWDTIRLRDGKYIEHWSIRDLSELSNPK